jgi:leader peptidase (prepilin peptidase)/N-methyltransferase
MALEIIPIILISLLGWLAGNAVNYLADRLPAGSRVPALHCANCHSKVPLINFLVWPRRCPTCGEPREARTWLVDLFYIGSAIMLWVFPQTQLGFAAGYLLLVYLGVIFVIDAEHKIIHTYLLLLGVPLGLLVGWLRGDLVGSLIGGLVGLVLVALLYLLGFAFTRLMVRWRGADLHGSALGFGDVLLSGVLGLMVGFPGVFSSLFYAVILAGLFSGIYILVMLSRKRYTPGTAIPYAPFLIIGALGVIYF